MLSIGLSLFFFFVELWVKRQILQNPTLPKFLCHGRLLLQEYHNYGLAFGRLRKYPKCVKIIVTLVLAGVIAYSIFWLRSGYATHLVQIALGLIFGGSLSNLYDRYRYGYVIDYFSFPKAPAVWFRRLVFNLADICIFLGILLLLLYILFC